MLLLANGRSCLKQRSVFTFVRLSPRLEAAVLFVDLGEDEFSLDLKNLSLQSKACLIFLKSIHRASTFSPGGPFSLF